MKKNLSLALMMVGFVLVQGCERMEVAALRACPGTASLSTKNASRMVASEASAPTTYASPSYSSANSCKYMTGSTVTGCILAFSYTNPYNSYTANYGSLNNFSFPSGGGTGCTGTSGTNGNCGQGTTFAGHTTVQKPITVSKGGDYTWSLGGGSATGKCNSSIQTKCAPLAVTFTDVNASFEGPSMIKVTWTTAQESNNDHFIVEKIEPCDATNKIDAAIIRTQNGDSSIPQTYETSIAIQYHGTYQISIVQVDKDGKRTESNTVPVRVK